MRAAVLGLVLLLSACGGFGALERGNRAYRDGRFAEAVEAYRAALRDGPASPELHYNLGTALLRLGRHEEAERELRAALRALEPELKERTYYNLGNRFLESGRAPDAEPAAAAQQLAAAVEAYKQALRLQPVDTAAKWNLELALRDQERNRQQSGGGRQQQEQDQPRQPEGGQGGGQPSAADPEQGQGRPGGSEAMPMTQAQAERILAAAEQDERQIFERKLRKGRRETPVARDW